MMLLRFEYQTYCRVDGIGFALSEVKRGPDIGGTSC